MATVTQPHEFAIRVVAKNSNEYRRCHVGGKEDKQSRHRAIAQASFDVIFKGHQCWRVGGKEGKQSRHRAIDQASFGVIFKGCQCWHVGGNEGKQSCHCAIAQATFGDIFKGRRCSWLMVNLESAGGLNLADFRQGERDKERIS